MIRALLQLSLAPLLGILAYSHHERESVSSMSMDPDTAEQNDIINARLAHFPSQIGHWWISRLNKNHNR